jgi:hypothetical protein
MQLQVVLDGAGRGEHGAFAQLLGHGAARQLQHRHQLGALGLAQALDALQVVARWRCSRPAMPSKPPLPPEVAAGAAAHAPSAARPCPDAGAQQQRQQFGVGQGGGAAGQQLFARARVGGQVFQGHGGPGGRGGARVSTMEASLRQGSMHPTRPASSRAPSSPCTTAWRPGRRHHQHLWGQARHAVPGHRRAVAGGRACLMGWKRARAPVFELPCGRGLWRAQHRHAAVGGAQAARPWVTPTSNTTWATWCSSPRPTAWAVTPARWCRWAKTGGAV